MEKISFEGQAVIITGAGGGLGGALVPEPHLQAYPPETVVADKLGALVSLGLTNSRMKDFFDPLGDR